MSVSDSISPPDSLLVGYPDLVVMVKLHKRQIQRLRKAGKFPQPLRLCRRPLWRRADIESFVASLSSPIA